MKKLVASGATSGIASASISVALNRASVAACRKNLPWRARS